MRSFFAVVLGAVLMVPVQAKAKPSIPLARQGKWEMNYDEDSCHLLAKFGQGDRETILNITRYQPGDSFDLVLYGKPVKVNGSPHLPVEIGFGDVPMQRR